MFPRLGERKRRSTNLGSLRRKPKKMNVRKSSATTFDEIPGLFQVKISASLQSVLSCRVGINITSNERWLYIDKETLVEELNNRSKKSDKQIRRIMTEIEAFPEDNILIGSYGSDQFFMCLSEYAKNVCENWRVEEKKRMLESLHRCLSREANKWITLASHSEIVLSRNPYCIQIALKPFENAKFEFRLAQDARDGYVDFVNTRIEYNILLRRRIDTECQVAKEKRNMYTQTTAPSSCHRSIQYKYTYSEMKQIKVFLQNLKKWFTYNYEDISSLIHTNHHINLYKNDYDDLPNQQTRHAIENPDLLMSLHDCVACHEKMVTCIAWNAFREGLIAAAYGRDCPKYIHKLEPLFLENEYITMDDPLVIIWNTSQPFKPLLYLHSKREVTSMKFCPYNQNILVGGCADGQIIVWDLNGKLDKQKPGKFQTAETEVLIKTSMTWFKYPPGFMHVFPCVESLYDYSHKSHITGIKFLPPEYYLDKLGEVSQDKVEHMQFLTTSLNDGTMLVWDLKPSNFYVPPKMVARSKKRMKHRPRSLDAEVSKFAYLNVDFRPMFRLDFLEGVDKTPVHVNDFSFQTGKFFYRPAMKGNKRVFVRNKGRERMNVKKEFLAATELGSLYRCSWTAHDYDLGLNINRQKLELSRCNLYHDGPIYHMQRSPFCSDLVLTTGGRVFAIWDMVGEVVKSPITWRKCAIRYVMACWSLQNGSSIIASREDGKIELWDFEEESKCPLRMTKFITDNLLSVYFNNSFYHVWKNTCIATDLSGILSIYSTPTKLFVYNMKPVRNYIQRIYERKKMIQYWIDQINKQRESVVVPVEDTPSQEEKKKRLSRLSSEIRRMSIIAKSEPKNVWQEKEYKRMYNILIDRNRINLARLEQARDPLNEILEERAARLKKIDGYIANKEKIYEEEKNRVLYDDNKRKTKLRVRFPKELSDALKEQFYENYKQAEIDVSKYIQTHQYRLYFDWQTMMNKAKQRYETGIVRSEKSVQSLGTEFRPQKLFTIIPKGVGRKSTRLLMTEIAIISTVSKN